MAQEDDGAVRPPARLRALVAWQVTRVATLAARLTTQRMPSGGRADYAVLAALEECGPLSQADIGRRLGLDRNDVNAIMSRLEGARFVTRRADPTNRSRNVVRRTAAGLRHLRQLQDHADAVQRELLTGLSADECQALQALLAKVLDSHGPQSA